MNKLSDKEVNQRRELVDGLMNEIESDFSGVDIWLSYDKFTDSIVLSKIVIKKESRGKGIGSAVMNRITRFADHNDMRIILTPSGDFGGSVKRLKRFYKKFGFRDYGVYEHREKMQRDPVVKLSEILFESDGGEEGLECSAADISDMEAEELMGKIVDRLSKGLDRDLLKPAYRNNPNPLGGHCYVASEALYYLLGSRDWVPCNVQHEGSPHWYLKNKRTGKFLDPTAGQFETPVPYSLEHGKGFCTDKISKRAAELLKRLNMEPRISGYLIDPDKKRKKKKDS